jgi:hypothetical protein
MIKVHRNKDVRVCQGDIFRDIELIESIHERRGELEVSKILFPLVIVLTQDCDLAQDHRVRSPRLTTSNHDKQLFSVLVAPLYNVEHVYAGQHLSELGLTMVAINKNKTPGANLRNNETPRYHYLEFSDDTPIANSVIDFKHYFSVNVAYLRKLKRTHFVRRVAALYREDISLRFAGFLSRIGLPDPPRTPAPQAAAGS